MDRITQQEADRRGLELSGSIKVDLKQMSVDRNLGGDRTVWKFKRYLLRDWINSWSDLGNVMDPNTLGDSETVWDQMQELFADADGEDRVESACMVLNAAQAEVDRWIQAGGLKL